MIVVADTGPINYLVAIGHIDLLREFFELVLIPPAVRHEWSAEGAPAALRSWIGSPPAWICVRASEGALANAIGGKGEMAAIALAKELTIPLLCDDEAARKLARKEGIFVSGTLGVLQQAHSRGKVDLRESIPALVSQTNFYLSKELRDRILAEAAPFQPAPEH